MTGPPRPERSIADIFHDQAPNWAGYIAYGTGFTVVAGQWTVPRAQASSSPKFSSAWIGIDGVPPNTDLIQTGTDSDSDGTYYAWYELIPAPAMKIGLPVAPGDQISAVISQAAPSSWDISISDLTSNATFAQTFSYSAPATTAEWIVERPSSCLGGCYLPLADFGSIDFAVQANDSSLQALAPEDMIDDSGNVIAHTSDFRADSTFTVTYVPPPPPPTTTTAPPTTTTAPPPPPPRSGYWMVDAEGGVYRFGDAGEFGSWFTPWPLVRAVHLEPTPDGNGYWTVDSTGAVYAFGDATYLGGGTVTVAGEAFASMSATPTGRGYWLFTNRGRVVPFGDAKFYGDMSAVALNGPVLDTVATPDGKGYYMVASDGGVFAFGDAVFHGSMGGTHLNGPVVGLAPDAVTSGYWLVASDGGIFAFGGAQFHGSMGGKPLNRAVIGMVAYGDGYLMVASDGGIFDFSAKPFLGSLGGSPRAIPIVGVAPLNR